MAHTRRKFLREVAVLISFISFCGVLLAYGLRIEIAVACLVAIFIYMLFRRPYYVIYIVSGLAGFSLAVFTSIYVGRLLFDNDVNPLLNSLICVGVFFWVVQFTNRSTAGSVLFSMESEKELKNKEMNLCQLLKYFGKNSLSL